MSRSTCSESAWHVPGDYPGGHRDIFSDQVVAGAIVDRLLHKATVLNIKGKSYRMRAHYEQQKT
jgi:DNA replication protein DnaC